jgi:hypothetical protein
MSSICQSQIARLPKQMCASGRMSTALSRLPAGTTSKVPSNWMLGTADPQLLQKLF